MEKMTKPNRIVEHLKHTNIHIIGVPRQGREKNRRNNGRLFSKLDENQDSLNPRSSMNSRKEKQGDSQRQCSQMVKRQRQRENREGSET
jgi:hypothetical protein